MFANQTTESHQYTQQSTTCQRGERWKYWSIDNELPALACGCSISHAINRPDCCLSRGGSNSLADHSVPALRAEVRPHQAELRALIEDGAPPIEGIDGVVVAQEPPEEHMVRGASGNV